MNHTLVLLLYSLVAVQAILWVRVGHQSNNVLPKTEMLSIQGGTRFKCSNSLESYFEFTANKYGDAGVTSAMVCDYVFDKGICCGGYFGEVEDNSRLLLSNACGYLTSDGWEPIANLPERLRRASGVPIKKNDQDVGWLVSGGQNIYGEVQLKMFWLNSDLSWTELRSNMTIPLMGHCTVQINETFVAFIGGTPDSEEVRVEQIYLYDLENNEFTKGPDLLDDSTESDFTTFMACHKMPIENIVVFGCTKTSKKLYFWDLDDNSITDSGYECPYNEGIFGVENNNRLILTGRNRRSRRFRTNTGFTTNYDRTDLNHRRGAAFAAPDNTYTCDAP